MCVEPFPSMPCNLLPSIRLSVTHFLLLTNIVVEKMPFLHFDQIVHYRFYFECKRMDRAGKLLIKTIRYDKGWGGGGGRVSIYNLEKLNPIEKELLRGQLANMVLQGVQEKLCFFTVHCNPSLAYISL